MELTDKYRPATFDEVLGQDTAIESLKKLIEIKQGLPVCLIFTGDSGIGKTTLARICAAQVGATGINLIEINGAAKTGIDDMREVLDNLTFMPFGKNKNRVVLVDEAHKLSSAAWTILLKPTEEPPPGTSWIFCSTEPSKIPKALQTRAITYELKKVSAALIKGLLTRVVHEEHYTTDNKTLLLISIKAEGSPRRALKFLEMAHGITDPSKLQEIIKTVGADDSKSKVIAMCQVLVRHGSWQEAVAAIRDAEEENETIRIVTTSFFNRVILNAKSEDSAIWPLKILDAFSRPCYPPDKLAPILLALASLLIGD